MIIESYLQIEKPLKNKRINVLAITILSDKFGKYYHEKKIFDDFATIKQVFESKDILNLQAQNCLPNYSGFKL